MIRSSIDIDRPPHDVFAYLDELERHADWQAGLITSRIETDGPVGVGTRVTDTRRVPGGPQEMTYEITEYEPPRKTSWRGISGPVRPVGTATVEPLDDGRRSRVTLELDLRGHGFGVVIAPLAKMGARRQIPRDQEKLKEILERSP